VACLMEGYLSDQIVIVNGIGCISLVIPFHDFTRKLKRCGQGC